MIDQKVLVRRVLRVFVAALVVSLLGASSGIRLVGTRVSSSGFVRQTGLQTNEIEIARFTALSGSGSYATDRSSLLSHANTAKNAWPFTISSGAWESDAGRCEPVGSNQVTSEYEISFAATDIWAMALSAEIEEATDPTNAAALRSAARTRLLEMTAITDFEASDLSGGNQCILDLGAAGAHIVEAALMLEDSGYVSWTLSDRVQLANWLATEVFPLVSWGIDARKNNWGIVTFASALAIAAYVDGGVPLLTKWNATTVAPSVYLSSASTPLNKWLSTANGDELDSECQDASQVFGLRSSGGFPDELRRSTGGGSNTANCSQASLAFACSSPTGPSFTCELDAKFYQQKTTNGLGHVCEILRRIDGNGARCFDLTSHGGNDEALYDAAQFSLGTSFTSYWLDDNAQGFRYVAGEYYADSALKAALDDGSVSVRGGRDYAYTKITHAPGVAYEIVVASAAEARCTALGSACGVSEPMNTATFTTNTGGSCADGVNANFSDSTGAKELGNNAWSNCGGLSMVATSGDAAMPSGGTASYVAKLSPVSSSGREMAVSGVPAGTKRHCARVYTKFSNPFAGFNSCGANKIAEFWAGGITQVQLSEVGGRIGLSAVGANWSNADPVCTGPATPYACCFGAGDGCGDQIGGVTNPTANQTFGLSDCTSNWCRVEICASTSDAELESGTNVTLEGTITQVGVGSPKTITYGPTFAGNMAGSWTETWVRTGYRENCSSGTDYFYMSHGMTANWTTNAGQTIGPASEVEGP